MSQNIEEKEEFIALKRRPSLKDLTPKQYVDFKKAFDMFDKNSDGYIDVLEMENVLKAIGHKPTQSDVMDVFRDVDKDQDGKMYFHRSF
jgi:calmodulin